MTMNHFNRLIKVLIIVSRWALFVLSYFSPHLAAKSIRIVCACMYGLYIHRWIYIRRYRYRYKMIIMDQGRISALSILYLSCVCSTPYSNPEIWLE